MPRPGIPKQTIRELDGFDPAREVIVIAVARADGITGDLTQRLSLGYDAAVDVTRLDVQITAADAPGQPLGVAIRLPGRPAIPADAVRLIEVDDPGRHRAARSAAPLPATSPPEPESEPEAEADPATTPEHRARISAAAGQNITPNGSKLDYRHDWAADGPPPEKFFDLSDPSRSLSVTLAQRGGAVYAVRLIETRREAGGSETHHSIILAHAAPEAPPLDAGQLTHWVARRLGTKWFRAIAWIWLGSDGTVHDPQTGEHVHYGEINDSPALSIRGPIAGSVEIKR